MRLVVSVLGLPLLDLELTAADEAPAAELPNLVGQAPADVTLAEDSRGADTRVGFSAPGRT